GPPPGPSRERPGRVGDPGPALSDPRPRIGDGLRLVMARPRSEPEAGRGREDRQRDERRGDAAPVPVRFGDRPQLAFALPPSVDVTTDIRNLQPIQRLE